MKSTNQTTPASVDEDSVALVLLPNPLGVALRVPRIAMRIAVAALAVSTVVVGCIPERDNPTDPAVAPRARIEVTIGSEPTSIGGRREDWVLDGSTSTDPDDSIASWTWSLSTSAEANPSSSEGWIEISDAEVVDPALGESGFLAALGEINDFSDGAGQQPIGAIPRLVRLVVKDHEGHKGIAVAPIIVVNTLPTVDLGVDRRIAPGGRWWTVDKVNGDANDDSVIDALDSPRRDVTVYANLADADPGDLAALAPECIVWRVIGYLAKELDVSPRDGFVDDDRFSADPSRRTLTFPAPLFPSASRFEVSVSDVLDADGALVTPTVDDVSVDVASTRWVIDPPLSTIVPLGTEFFRSTGVAAGTENSTLAAEGGRILVGGPGPGTGTIGVVAHTLLTAKYRDDFLLTQDPSSMKADGDGRNGWWVLDSQFGELHHLDADLSSSPVTPLSNPDGQGGNELLGAQSLVAADDPAQIGAWVAGNNVLLHLSPTGLLSSTALPATSVRIASAPDGGGWALRLNAGVPTLDRFDSNGVLSPSIDLSADLGSVLGIKTLDYDGRNDIVWGAYNGPAAPCTFRRDSTGDVLQTCGTFGASILADEVDGTMVTFVDQGFLHYIGRFDANLNLVGAMPLSPGLLPRRTLLAEGGSVVADVFDSSNSQYFLAWIEGGTVRESPPSFFVPGIQGVSAAVDGGTGAAWTFDEVFDSLVELLPDGSTGRIVDLGVTGADNIALAFDVDTRRLWIAWNSPDGAGLSYLDLTDDPTVSLLPVTTNFTGPDQIFDVDVVPGGQVCVAGRLTTDSQPIATGWVYRPGPTPETVQVETSDLVPFNTLAGADSLNKGCYFLPNVGDSQLFRTAYLGPTGTSPITPSNELNAPGGQTRPFRGGVTDYFTTLNPTRFWVLDESSQSGFPTRIFSFYDFTANQNYALGGPTFILSQAGPYDEITSLDFDPFYRHFYVGIGDPTFGPVIPGRVLRIDAALNFTETASYSGFLGPVVVGAP